MAVWFVSRHPGAIEWIKTQSIHIDHWATHLDTNQIQPNDVVIGTLPVHLASQVCEKGATFYFLSINVKPEQRGTEITAQQLVEQGCLLQAFHIEKR